MAGFMQSLPGRAVFDLHVSTRALLAIGLLQLGGWVPALFSRRATRLLRLFARGGIEIRFPQFTLHAGAAQRAADLSLSRNTGAGAPDPRLPHSGAP